MVRKNTRKTITYQSYNYMEEITRILASEENVILSEY